MKNNIKLLALLAIYHLSFITYHCNAQNIGINPTGAAANASALLDLDATGGPALGLLVPRIALTAINLAAPVTSPATSLLVYNTATANTGALAVSPGYYYWDATKWVRLQTTASTAQDWSLLGNAGTTAGTNFLGTTDAQDVVVKTNGVENMRILNANGNVGIGITSPAAKLHVVDNQNIRTLHVEHNFNGLVNTDAAFIGGIDAGYSSTGLFVLQKDNISFGSTGTNLINVVSNSVSQMVVNGVGNVGIGIATPNAKLDVTSVTQGFAMPRMTSVQRKAITAPIAGLQVYDTNLKGYYTYDGTKWDCVTTPAGTVDYFANVTVPNGYLECNGQAVNRITYAELFAAIGTLYGAGDGSTTFNVPDLRGEFIRGADNGRGVDAVRVLGSGQSSTEIGTYAHSDAGSAGATAAITVYSNQVDGSGAAVTGVNSSYYMGAATAVNGGPLYVGSFKIRPRNVALMPCIKF